VNTRYRKNGVLRKVATTPMTKAEWVLSKVSYQIVVSFMSMTALIIVATLVFGVRVHINVLVILLVITGSMTFSGMGMIVARFVKDEEAAESAGGAINFPMMFLSGIFFPLEFMPAFLQVVAKAMPLYYLGEGLRDAMINNNLAAALANSAVIFVLGAVIVAIGSLVSAWTDE
jgi:ABC-2 type transport system permease protein